jgi:hypothetical protein
MEKIHSSAYSETSRHRFSGTRPLSAGVDLLNQGGSIDWSAKDSSTSFKETVILVDRRPMK